MYCSGCEAFITQKDLKDGKCVLHQKEPEKVEEENLILVGNRCEYGGIEYTGTSKEIDLLDKISGKRINNN